MTLPSSGPLALTDIQTEFGGANPIGMNEYYAGGGLVPAGTSGTYGAVPSSGALSIQNFYGTSNVVPDYVEDVFSTYLYTGDGATQTITNGINLSGNGGLIWLKKRQATENHYLWDSARNNFDNALCSNLDIAQFTQDALNVSSTGFSFTGASYNNSGQSYVSWTFRKQPKFFDVVTYTGDGEVTKTISHNLGAVPGCIIIKKTNNSSRWTVYHRSLTAGNLLQLETTGAQQYDDFMQGAAAPTSTTFTAQRATSDGLNGNGATYVAYLFAHDAGGFGLTGSDNVISCGSFTGATTVNLGYEPQWVLLKSTTAVQDWFLIDTMRGWTADGGYNFVQPNNAYPEAGGTNGPRPTSTGFYWPYGGNTYIYIAIRRGPMKVPTVGTSVFAPVTYTGNGATQTITAGFPVDMMLVENSNKDFTYANWAVDRLRGVDRQLYTDDTTSELTDGTYKGFDNNVGLTFTGNGNLNGGGANYITWFFRRAPSFFDEVCYTGVGTATTKAHNLGVVPEMMILKNRSSAAPWPVYAAPAGINADIYLNSNTSDVGGSAYWNNTAPTSTVFSIGSSASTGLLVNNSGSNYVAYLFATCAGVSKVGSYTGTGALQTINCGFSTGARFVLIKRTNGTGNWYVWDSARGISSGNDPYLILNGPQPVSQVTGTNYVDTTSVGFQVTAAASGTVNVSGGNYIFLAVA